MEKRSSDDRFQLTNFICTDPPKRQLVDGRRQHPREWELYAQSGVRTLRVPAPPAKSVIVGCDDGGIAGVCQYEYEYSESGADAFVNVIAVALRAQGHGYSGQVPLTTSLP